MKFFEKFLYHAALYTVGISIGFFLFAEMLGIPEVHMTFLRYFTIMAFSFVVSASEFIFTIERIAIMFRYLIHYFVLAVSFAVMFFAIRKGSSDYSTPGNTIFAAVALFTIIYLLSFAVLYLTKRIKAKKAKNSRSKTEKEEYVSRFG